MSKRELTMPGDGIPQTLYSLIYYLERRVVPHFRGTGLHWGLRRILQYLWLEDGLSQSELARAARFSEASISNMLKHLVNGGWVERRTDTYDYRIMRVFLTQKGIDMRSAVEMELSLIDQDLKATLSGKEYVEFAGRLAWLLSRLTDTDGRQGNEDRPTGIHDRAGPPGNV